MQSLVSPLLRWLLRYTLYRNFLVLLVQYWPSQWWPWADWLAYHSGMMESLEQVARSLGNLQDVQHCRAAQRELRALYG